MKISLLAFGIAKEIFQTGQLTFEIPREDPTVGALRSRLEMAFPDISRLASYMIAINDTYASDSESIKVGDEIAIIPPVSGG